MQFHPSCRLNRRIPLLVIFDLLVFGVLSLFFVPVVQAFPPQQEITSTPQPQPTSEVNQTSQMSIGNDTCLGCHGQPGLTLKLVNGDQLDLYVSASDFHQSIHGSLGYACVQCHTTVGNYPHPAFTAQDRRDVSLKLFPACQRCHASQYALAQDSVHATALANGNRQAAICTDCHTAHNVRRLTDPTTHKLLSDARIWIPQTCAQCHDAIYKEYLTSVHGSALVGEGNPDVPTCIDCHGVHNIENPTTAAFRLKSPQLCAKCHTDEKIMGKYGISTQVLNTYVADFHGTTVEIFQKESPDAQVNKPVCFDCHGVHNIARVDDPQRGLQIEQNLLARCRVCHPDASANFPTAWLSHYIPSPTRYPVVYYVNLFYKFFIPTVLGGMAILIVLDLNKLVQKRLPVRQKTATVEPLEEQTIDQPVKKEGIHSIEVVQETEQINIEDIQQQNDVGQETELPDIDQGTEITDLDQGLVDKENGQTVEEENSRPSSNGSIGDEPSGTSEQNNNEEAGDE
jgi:hypothetical protein